MSMNSGLGLAGFLFLYREKRILYPVNVDFRNHDFIVYLGS